MQAWVVRAGRGGVRAEVALREGLVIAGWEEVGDLTEVASREELRLLLADVYPDLSPQVIGNWTGQLWRFRTEINIDDVAITPHAQGLAVGYVVGPYVYRADEAPGFRHVRGVKWSRTVERSAVQPDLRDSLGSLLTVFELSRHEAAQRMDALAATGIDPGPSAGTSTGAGLGKAGAGQAEARLMTLERLDELVRAAEASGEPVTLTIRQFLGIWGHTHRRPSVTAEIQADLEAQGLATKPPFADGNINSTITVLPVGAEPGSGTQVPTAAELPDDQPDPDDRPVTFLVRQLPSAELNADLYSVQPGEELRRATTIMGLNNFSQLPVLTPDGRLHGAVSWETVGLAYLSNPTPSLADATTRQVREVDGDDDLLDWIEEIYRRGYIFVRNTERSVTGVITAADLTLQLGSQLRPFLLLAEIERRLRRIIDRAMSERRISLDQVRSQLRGNRRNRVHEARHLTMGEYRWILEPEDVWSTLGWYIDRELFTERLRIAAEFRNDLMHLNPDLDPEAESELAPLRGLLAMLRSLDTSS